MSLIGGVWYFVLSDSDGKIEIATPKNKLRFNIKQNQLLSKFSVGISPVVANKKINFKQKKIKNILIVSADKKVRKRKMVDVIDTIIVKALQNYENYIVLNPLDVDIRSDYMTEKINSFKGYLYEVCVKNLLFSAGMKNDTQQIFIVRYNLDSAKKALINGKTYSLLGIINLSEVKNWEEVKGKSVYVSVKFDDISSIESSNHFAFKFKTSFPTEILEFKIELLDDQAKQVGFNSSETKVPAVDIQIDILK